MRTVPNGICIRRLRVGLLLLALLEVPLFAEPISLQTLVAPSTVFWKDGHQVTFAVHGFVEFPSLTELFPYIESQAHRWKTGAGFDDAAIRQFATTCCAVASRAEWFRWSMNVPSKL